MKPQRNTVRLIGMAFLFVTFMSFTFLLPSVFAQEGNSTPTPSETPPLPEVTPEPFEVPELEQEVGVQSLMSLQDVEELGGDWAAQVNISDTEGESFKPKIAADNAGNLHMIWRETINGKQEIYYSWMDADKTTQSFPVNVSNSPSFNSDSPQLVVDSAGVAHIVWQEEDNDHADDYETQYSNCQIMVNEQTGNSATCSIPTTLSNGQACGSFVGDWKATDPSIGIDGNDNLMVAWMSFEPNPRLYTMFSLWSASGSPPSNRTGCNVATGSYYYPVVAGDSNGDFHLLRMNASATIFYSKYSGGSWSANQTIGTGWLPVLNVDSNDKLHAAWWDLNAPPKYRSKEGNSATWSAVENIFSSTRCSDLSLITDGNNLPRLVCANGAVYEASRQAGGWVETTIVPSMAGQPDLVKDSTDNLHLVWSDSRSGSWDTFYSPTYTCEGIEPASDAGKAVLSTLQNPENPTPFLNYCKNQVEEVIYVPAPNGENDPNEAFKEWADLASSAKHEVAFTVMFWDKRDDTPYPGEKVLTGIQQLYDEVTDEANENKYPHGMKVRILLGVRNNFQDFPWPDQRLVVLDGLQDLNIPIYEPLSNGRAWKVEVAVYRDGLQFGIPPGIFSHVKLMVVDNNKMIVSGYHPQYGFQTIGANAENHDLGVKVLGPIAANGMTVFDSLWEGSEVLCTEEDAPEFDSMNLRDCDKAIAENPTHWFFAPQGEDIVLPLYRDNTEMEKTADEAVKAAIESANTHIYVLQNRFGVPGDKGWPLLYFEDGLLQYADALLKEANENTEIRILVSKTEPNLSSYNIPSLLNFIDLYYSAGGQQAIVDLVRFYDPNESTSSPPGLHTKSFMVDGKFLVIGSQNFDHSAFGNNDNDLDLTEYSLGIEDAGAVTSVEGYFENAWDNSGKFLIVNQNDSLETRVGQASTGDVVALESGAYEISSTLNIPEGVTIVGLNATIVPAPNFSSEAGGSKLAKPALQTGSAPLLRITGSNVTLIGLTLQDSPGYAIETGNGILENIHISNTVFEDNALGGVHVQGSANYTIENNTFVGSSSGVTINVNSNATGIIRNNIFAGQNIVPVQIISTDDGTVEYSYNLFYDCVGSSCASGWHTGNLGAASSAHDNLFDVDPLFLNPAIGNYRLYPNSPAIDAGDPTILHEFLFDGNGDGVFRIDIGAFEYGIVPNVAPVANAGNDQTVNLSNSVTINAAYSDADTPDGHFARIDWGDGNIEDVLVTPTSPNAGEVIGEHTYSDEGNYTVEVCVTDLYGAAGCDTTNIIVTPSSILVDFYLRGSGANANPAVLFLDPMASTSTTAKYKDSTSINFNSGNLWKDIGAWALEPAQISGELIDVDNLQIWLGLKNSDDQGTNFDLRAEFYKNDILIASGESLCIAGITRNPNLAKQLILPVDNLVFAEFDGSTDTLLLKVKTRIGTDGAGNHCGGHSNAVGLRLYFDAAHRLSGFEGTIVP